MGFTADDEAAGGGEIDLGKAAGPHVGARGHPGVQLHAMLAQRGAGECGVHAVEERQTEQGAGRGAQSLGIVGAHGALEEHGAGGSEGLGGAQDGAGIAGILESVENDDQGFPAKELLEAPYRRLDQGHDALAGFGAG